MAKKVKDKIERLPEDNTKTKTNTIIVGDLLEGDVIEITVRATVTGITCTKFQLQQIGSTPIKCLSLNLDESSPWGKQSGFATVSALDRVTILKKKRRTLSEWARTIVSRIFRHRHI